MNHGILSIAAILVMVAGCESDAPADANNPPGQGMPEAIDQLDSTLTGAAARGMNGVVHVQLGDEVLLHKAYGWRDREQANHMSTDDGFDIGSLVKPLTAVAVLKAEEDGLISTRDSIGNYFPEAPADKRGITLAQLLRHRGGFQDYIGDDYELISRAEAVNRILAAPLLYPPGTERAYSNSGYTLLAIVLEIASGQSYEAYVREAVLEPAGVPEIGYVLPGWSDTNLAIGYAAEGERWGTPIEKPWLEDGVSWTFRGAGGMLGTAQQVSRWYQALIEGKVLGSKALAQYFEFAADPSPNGEGRMLAHAGGNRVFNTLQLSWIEDDLHFTLFTSTAEPLNAETVVAVDQILALATAVNQERRP